MVATNLLDDLAVRGIVINSRDVTGRRQAIEDLRRLNEDLDLRVRERTEAITMLYDIVSVANHARDVKQAVEFCLRRLTEFNGWRFGHALMPTTGGEEMVLACSWYPKGTERFARFRRATESIKFRDGEGLTCRVIQQRTPVWTTQLPNELTGTRSIVASELGLGTAVAFPVIVGEKVAAVLEFFSNQHLDMDEKMIELLSSVGMQLGRVIERANLQEHLLRIADQMQQRIAQDLHDDLGQELTGLGLKTETLAETLGGDALPARNLAADVHAAVERTRGKVRSLARRILPVEVELNSLSGALTRLAEDATIGSRAACTFHGDQAETTFDNRTATQLYRIAQEALANALRHGEARNIRIDLAEEDGETVLSVTDDGVGMPPGAETGEGLGLRIMQYRAELLGGKLTTHPSLNGGTVVVCRVAAVKSNQLVRKRRRKHVNQDYDR